MLTSLVSLIPRTRYQMMTVSDAAVSWKWLVELPSDVPTPIEGPGTAGASQEDSPQEQSFFDKAVDLVGDVLSVVQTVTSYVDNLIGPSLLMMRAEDVQVPNEQITSTSVRTQARNRSFPDMVTVDSMTVTFYEDYNYSALTFFQRWKKAIVNDFGVFRLPNGEDGYAKELKVHVFDTVGLRKGTFVCENCYPEDIESYSLTSESGVIKTIVKFNVHRIRFEPSILNSGSIGSSAQTVIGQIF